MTAYEVLPATTRMQCVLSSVWVRHTVSMTKRLPQRIYRKSDFYIVD